MILNFGFFCSWLHLCSVNTEKIQIRKSETKHVQSTHIDNKRPTKYCFWLKLPFCSSRRLTRAREDKERKYAELIESERCQLMVVALETGGRWSTEAKEFMDSLAAARAREAPRILWRSAFLGWRRRWSRMLAVSCARAFAVSLVALPTAALSGTHGPSPDLADLFAM